MSEVLFTQSYLLRFDPKLHEAMQPYPPLGCLQAAAVVREMGMDVAVFDAMLAQDETKTNADRALYDKEFQKLDEFVFNIRSKTFNGVNSAVVASKIIK